MSVNETVWESIFDGPPQSFVPTAAELPPVNRGSRWRVSGAILTNATSSLGNLALGIAIARIGTLTELGQYGVALAVYVLATGLVRTAVTDTVLTHEYSSRLARESSKRTILLGLVAAVTTVITGAILSQPTSYYSAALSLGSRSTTT